MSARWVVGALVGAACAAHAADPTKSATEAMSQNLATVGSGGGLGNAVSHPSGVEISSEQGDSTVTLKISGTLTSTLPANKHGASTGVADAWSITVQAPVSKADKPVLLGTLDRLSSSTTIELKYTSMHAVGFRSNSGELQKYCDTVLAPAAKKKDGTKPADLPCTDEMAVKYLKGKELDDFYNIEISPDFHYYTWGFSAKGGYKDFDFFDSASLDKQTERKSQWSAQIFGSLSPFENALAVGSFQIQQSYDDASSKTLCPAAGSGTAPVQCVNGPIGIPVDKRSELLTLEYRQALKSMAWALSVTRDFKNKLSGVQLPIYLVSDSKGSLTGGVRLDWTSDTHKTSVGVFVGQPFKLLD